MKTNQNIYLDIHAIQSVPPSNINRDDTGSPKTCQYGGVRRSRVSSQSWKRAMRQYFHENAPTENVGVRTLEIVRYIADIIQAKDSSITDEEAMKLSEKALNDAGVKTSKQKARALFFLGYDQANKLAEAAIEGISDKKELKKLLGENPAIDIALFGRMVADDPSLNEDASSQVAHAISTHAVATEFDFFTAVDDLAPEDNAGAGMLGTVEFNSSTLYRYANVAVHELLQQLGNKETTISTLKLFIKSFANSLPTGKVNTFANQTLPKFLMINVRHDRPVSLVSAFEEPIRSNSGYAKDSIDRLFKELKQVERFVEKPLFSLFICLEDKLEADTGEAKEVLSMDELLGGFAEKITASLANQ